MLLSAVVMAGFSNGTNTLVNLTVESCSNYIFFEGGASWGHRSLAVLYALSLLYCFVGLATITDLYMQAMETIVQQTRKAVRYNYETGSEEVVAVRIWNPVIADITLLALGTSAPQISLAIIDAVQQLGRKTSSGLGPGTLVGSAAFNLYPILAVCVLVPKAGSVKRIQQVGVWIVELVWSIWAYIWLAIILQVSSPNVVEPWEAVCTVLQFPILMLHAYVQDIGWRAFLPSGSSSWKRLGSFHAEQPSKPSVYSEQGKPEWELVEFQNQRTPKGASSVDTQISPSEHQLVSITINGNDPVTTGDDKTLVNNQMFVKLQSSDESYEQTSTWASIRLLWKQQYFDTIFIKSRVDETGKEIKLTAVDRISYLITFPWRVVFAFLPPPALWHGWPAFLCALAYITVIANFLIKLATQFGCVTGVPDYALALTVLAIGTSWPDLIASKIAAEHQPTADSAIANINASNCINVYVGIGIPWLLQSLYNNVHLHEKFEVPSAGLGFSLMLFFVTFALCQVVVVVRRLILGGELGGPRKWAWASSGYFMCLWLIFVVLSCLRNYHLL